MRSIPSLLAMQVLVFCAFAALVFLFTPAVQANVLRERRSGVADQELFHMLEKMKHRPNPVAGIIDVNRIGKRMNRERSYPWKDRAEDQEDWPFADFNYAY